MYIEWRGEFSEAAWISADKGLQLPYLCPPVMALCWCGPWWRWLRMTGSQMPFHLQLICQRKCPGFRQMGTGRCNYAAADLQCVHATALCDGAVTRFMLGPPSLLLLLRHRRPKAEYLGLNDQPPPLTILVLYNSLVWVVFIMGRQALHHRFITSWENYCENVPDRNGKMWLINSACND